MARCLKSTCKPPLLPAGALVVDALQAEGRLCPAADFEEIGHGVRAPLFAGDALQADQKLEILAEATVPVAARLHQRVAAE